MSTKIYISDPQTQAVADVDDGIKLLEGLIPGGQKNQAIGNIGVGFEEYVLASGVDYLLRVTNLSGSATPVSVEIHFYEE